MTIQNNTHNIYQTTANSVQKTQATKETSFDSLIENNNAQNPTKIPFQDYKSYSINDINNMFPPTADKALNDRAMDLRDIANGTTDDTLNKILFNLNIKEKTTVAEDIIGGDMALLINGLKLGKILEREMIKVDNYMGRNNIPLTIENLSKLHDKFKEHVSYDEARTNEIVTPQEYFDSLELTNKDMLAHQEHHKNNPWLIHIDEVKEVINNIKYEYQKNTYEKNVLLGKYS